MGIIFRRSGRVSIAERAECWYGLPRHSKERRVRPEGRPAALQVEDGRHRLNRRRGGSIMRPAGGRGCTQAVREGGRLLPRPFGAIAALSWYSGAHRPSLNKDAGAGCALPSGARAHRGRDAAASRAPEAFAANRTGRAGARGEADRNGHRRPYRAAAGRRDRRPGLRRRKMHEDLARRIDTCRSRIHSLRDSL